LEDKALTSLRTIQIVALCMFCAPARPIAAAIIGVTVGENGGISQSVKIGEQTGKGFVFGSTGFYSLNSLAKHSAGIIVSAGADVAYGMTKLLVFIDPRTGVGSAGPLLNFGKVGPDIRGLAFSPDGILYAANNTGPAGGLNPDDLFIVDLGTGSGTLVGHTGLTGLQDIAFSPSGVLYGWDVNEGLVVIDPATGIATDVNTRQDGNTAIQAISFTPAGELLGAGSDLVSISPTTGAATLIGGRGYPQVRGIIVQ